MISLTNSIGIGCKVLFMTPRIGRHNLEEVLAELGPKPKESGNSNSLEEIVILRDTYQSFPTYNDIIARGAEQPAHLLQDRESTLRPGDVCNLQFTSGSTGNPKAAMLTHQYVSNHPNPKSQANKQ